MQSTYVAKTHCPSLGMMYTMTNLFLLKITNYGSLRIPLNQCRELDLQFTYSLQSSCRCKSTLKEELGFFKGIRTSYQETERPGLSSQPCFSAGG